MTILKKNYTSKIGSRYNIMKEKLEVLDRIINNVLVGLG